MGFSFFANDVVDSCMDTRPPPNATTWNILKNPLYAIYRGVYPVATTLDPWIKHGAISSDCVNLLCFPWRGRGAPIFHIYGPKRRRRLDWSWVNTEIILIIYTRDTRARDMGHARGDARDQRPAAVAAAATSISIPDVQCGQHSSSLLLLARWAASLTQCRTVDWVNLRGRTMKCLIKTSNLDVYTSSHLKFPIQYNLADSQGTDPLCRYRERSAIVKVWVWPEQTEKQQQISKSIFHWYSSVFETSRPPGLPDN